MGARSAEAAGNSWIRRSLVLNAVAGLTLLGNIVLQVVMARTYGAGPEVALFFLILAFPSFLMVIANEVVSVTVARLLNRGQLYLPSINEYLRLYLRYIGGVTVAVVLLALGSEWLIPDSWTDADLSRTLAVTLFAATWLGFQANLLLQYQYLAGVFAVPSVAHIFPSLGMIVLTIAAGVELGIVAAAYGNVLGASLQVLFLAVLCKRASIRRALGAAADALLPRTQGQAMSALLGAMCFAPFPLIPVIERWVGSAILTPTSYLAALGYSWSLASGVWSLMVRGLTVATSFHFSNISLSQTRDLQKSVSRIFAYISVALTPSLILLINIREDLVELLLVRGAFTKEDGGQAAQILMYHLVALWGLAVFVIGLRVLYAMDRSINAAVLGSAFVIAHFGLCIMFGETGNGGVALGTAVTTWLFAGLVIFQFQISTLFLRRGLATFLMWTMLSSGAALVTLVLCSYGLQGIVVGTTVKAVAIGAMSYLLWRIREITE